jgi:hypothetical protein
MDKKNNNKSDFKAGFKSNSLLAIVIAFLLCACLIIGLELFIGSGGLLKISDYATSGVDGDGFGTTAYYVYDDVYKDTNMDRIYYLGGSSAQYAVDYKHFRKCIEEKFKKQYRFVPLSNNKQEIIHALQIVQNLPDGNGVVIIGMHYGKMFNYSRYNKMYLKSDYFGYNLAGIQIVKEKNYRLISGIFLRRFLDRLFLAESVKHIVAPVPIAPIEHLINDVFDRRKFGSQKYVKKDDSMFNLLT